MREGLLGKAWRNLRTVGALCYYLGIVPMFRIPTLLPFVFATPFTILFILYVTGNPAAFRYGVAGAITMSVSQQGLFLGADLTNLKIEHKFQSIVVASPVTPACRWGASPGPGGLPAVEILWGSHSTFLRRRYCLCSIPSFGRDFIFAPSGKIIVKLRI